MNLILVVIDSLRADHLGCYGNSWIKTPNFDAFAKESVLFERCHPESLPTIPMRRCLHTGNRLFPFRDWQTKAGDTVTTPGWAPFRETDTTLSEILLPEGYRTAFISDVYHMFKPSMNFHRSFKEWRFIRGQEYDQYRSAPPPAHIDVDHYLKPEILGTYIHTKILQYLSNTAFRKGEEDYFSPMVFGEAMRWVEENQDAENFFLWVDSFDPHEPWDPPQEYRDLYNPGYTGKEIINCAVGNAKDYLTEEELKHTRALYAAEVTLVDKWFGKLVEKVRELGLMENTLFVMVSDHGHPLGEHGIIHKHPSAMYPTLMDCPMMIRHPSGVGAGTRVSEFVYQHDLFTTMLNQLGVEPPEPVDSQDLWPLVTGQGGPKREFVTCGIGRFVWVKDDHYAYIAETDGTHPRLFDLKTDPGNFKDISVENPEICKEMHRKAETDAGGPLPDFSYLTGYSAKAEFRTGQDQKKTKI